MERAILYTRVSTDEQAEKGYSLADQKDKLLRYCNDHNIEVAAIFVEDHSAKTFNRPEFSKLLDYIKNHKGQVQQLLFHKWDRFSRNATDSFIMIRQLEKLNIRLCAIEQPLDLRIPENKMILAIYLTSPEIENDRRSMNVTNGMRRAMKQGRWVCTAPRGYSNKRDEFNKPIIVPNIDARFIQKAFTELAKGIMPIDQIRRELNKDGFVCSRTNFFRLIKNPVYCGKIQLKANHDEEPILVDAIHEPLISEELFYEVQNVLSGRSAKNNQPKVHKGNSSFPLRGFLECPRCGKKLTGSASKGNGGKYPYYHCLNGCAERIKVEEVHKGVGELLKSYSFKPEIRELFRNVVMDSINESKVDRNTRISNVNTEIEKTRKRLDSLQNKYIDNEIDKEDFYQLKAKYTSTINDLTSKKEEARIITNDISVQLNFCMGILENLSGFYENADLAGKQRILGSIFTGNLIFSEKKVRTTKVNEVVSLLVNVSKDSEKKKTGQSKKKIELSRWVISEGLEPSTLRTGI